MMGKKRKRTPEERAAERARYVRHQRLLARRIVQRQVSRIAPEERERFAAERLAYYELVARVPPGSFSV
jgi:hypothetical protein